MFIIYGDGREGFILAGVVTDSWEKKVAALYEELFGLILRF